MGSYRTILGNVEDNVPQDDIAGAVKLMSASDEYVLNCTETSSEGVCVGTNLSGRTTNVKLNSLYLFSAPVEPE